MQLLPAGRAFLLVEFGGESREEAEDGARKALTAIGRSRTDDTVTLHSDKAPQEHLWKVRESGLGATAYVPMERDHWPGWEDAAVPPERVGDYLRDFDALLDQHGYRAALYGHFGDGCIHCRIDFDLRTDGGIRNWRRFLDEAADLVVGYGGSLSGEHGDGQARAELLEKMYGVELLKAMEQLKAIWDPGNRMNPHKVVDPYPIVSNLKLGAGYHRSNRAGCISPIPRTAARSRTRRCAASAPAHAEFLAKHYKRRLRPRAAYTMGLIMLHARLASRMPRLANALASRAIVKRLGGIATERQVPPFAPETFQAWLERRGAVNPHGEPVVVFPDTFNNFLHPEPLKATVAVLEATGFRVLLPEQPLCCGRPLYDYGMLPTAGRFLHRLVDVLAPHVRAGTHVVGVEPSCVAVFRDELVGMLPHDEDAKRISLQTLTLAEFLQNRAPGWDVPKLRRKALVHGHCHHKAVMSMSAEQALYDRMGLDAELLDSGCCGMAGSFGFEAEHYDTSVQIGEHKLLPIVRDASPETLLIADGFSCKTQIEQLTDRRALHTAQVIKMAIDSGPDGVPGAEPERSYPDVLVSARR